MASRTRNRALGIAALIMAVVAATVILLLSQSGDDPQVTPLREDAAASSGRARADSERPFRFLPPVPVPGARPSERTERERKRARHRKSSKRQAAPRKVRVRRHELPRPARSKPRRPRTPAAPSPPPASAAPHPVSVPVSPGTPSASAGPGPSEEPAIQPTSPVKVPPAETRPVGSAAKEIEIEDGELEDDLDRVHARDGGVRFRVRSDELVLVELEDSSLTWLVPANGQGLIEFDWPVKKSAKLDLRHRSGMLVLRVHD